MTYQEFFNKIKAQFADKDVSGISEHLAFQYCKCEDL